MTAILTPRLSSKGSRRSRGLIESIMLSSTTTSAVWMTSGGGVSGQISCGKWCGEWGEILLRCYIDAMDELSGQVQRCGAWM